MSSVAGYMGTASTYDLNSFLPEHWRGWDDYVQRLGRYEVLDGYYHNVAYHSIVSYSEQLKSTERLYKHVRGVYNQAHRAVEIYPAKVYGGALDMQHGTQGAIPIATENPALLDAITHLWHQSRWGQKKSLYVRNGAKFGDSFLKIIDDVQRGVVYLEVLDPRKVKSTDVSPSGDVMRMEIEYYIHRNGKLATYREVLTPDRIETYVDGEAAAVHVSGRGEGVAMWNNPYGFVPVVHVQHRDVGMTYGGNVFYTSMHKINELNDLASILNDGARRQVRMPLVAFGSILGGTSGTNTANAGESEIPLRDSMAVLQMSPGDDIKALPPAINIGDTMQAVLEILAEIERDLPELSLHRLRMGAQATAPGVRAAYDDAIAKIQEARGNYDSALVRAQQMAIAIGGMRNYDGYRGFGLGSMLDGSLSHHVAPRPVIADGISKERKVELTLQAIQAQAPLAVYVELGYDEMAAQALAGTVSSQRILNANASGARLAELGRSVRSNREAMVS